MKRVTLMLLLGISFCLIYCENESPEPTEPTFQTANLQVGPVTIPSTFGKVYESSFENVTKKNAQQLVWEMPNWFEFAAMHKEDGGSGNGLGGARMWVEASRVRTGKKSIGLELFDIERSRRSEFNIFPETYVGNEYYISYWLYLPTYWGLFEPNINWDWFEIGNTYTTKGVPYASIHISKPDKSQTYFTVSLSNKDQLGKATTIGSKLMTLPKGRWFQVVSYVKRDVKNGAIKLWFDGQLIGERTGIPTKHTTSSNFAISIAKIYHERGDKVAHQLWIDDLTLYGKIN